MIDADEAGQTKRQLAQFGVLLPKRVSLWAFHNVILFSSKNLTNQIL